MNFYKVLDHNGKPYHGGNGTWHLPKGKRPGKWMPKIADIEPCVRGYHLCTLSDLLEWFGPDIWIAEGRGEKIQHQNKVVFSQARLLRRVANWNEKNSRLFACDCAERALKKMQVKTEVSWKAIEVARKFAQGEASKKELAAAGAAARAVAGAAARAVAGVAAWDAAWAAARAVAGAAAWDAAWDAAWAAERKWQARRLKEYLKAK